MPIVIALGAALVGGIVIANNVSKPSSPQKAAPPPQQAANPQAYVLTPVVGGNPNQPNVGNFTV